MVRGDRRGFSMVEATIAMTISTILVLAVGSVFIAQSTFYGRLNGDTGAQDHARSFVTQIQNAVGAMVDEGILLAQAQRLVIRRPQTLALVCWVGSGNNAHSHLTAGVDAVDDAMAAGVAKLDTATGAWDFQSGSVGSVTSITGGTPAQRCENNSGTDTVGARDDFMRLNGLNSWFGSVPNEGDIYMIFEEVEFRVQASALPPNLHALYRGEYGGTLTEVVSGLDSIAGFQYRVSGTWASTVSGSNLANIDAVRVQAYARVPAGGTADDSTFELIVEVPVR